MERGQDDVAPGLQIGSDPEQWSEPGDDHADDNGPGPEPAFPAAEACGGGPGGAAQHGEGDGYPGRADLPEACGQRPGDRWDEQRGQGGGWPGALGAVHGEAHGDDQRVRYDDSAEQEQPEQGLQ